MEVVTMEMIDTKKMKMPELQVEALKRGLVKSKTEAREMGVAELRERINRDIAGLPKETPVIVRVPPRAAEIDERECPLCGERDCEEHAEQMADHGWGRHASGPAKRRPTQALSMVLPTGTVLRCAAPAEAPPVGYSFEPPFQPQGAPQEPPAAPAATYPHPGAREPQGEPQGAPLEPPALALPERVRARVPSTCGGTLPTLREQVDRLRYRLEQLRGTPNAAKRRRDYEHALRQKQRAISDIVEHTSRES